MSTIERSTEPAANGRKRPRRWKSFTLGSFFLVFTALCVPFGLYVNKLRHHRTAVLEVGRWNAYVWYDYQVNQQSGRIDENASPPTDGVIATLLGPESMIDVDHLLVNDKDLTDSDLAHIQYLNNIRYLGLDCPKITDAGLKHLASCSKLNELSIVNNNNITDTGLMDLAVIRHLPELRLHGLPLVTDAGRQKLKDALPNCTIRYSHIGERAFNRTVRSKAR